MDSLENKSLPKTERLNGENNISTLLKKGKFISGDRLKMCYYKNPENQNSRIMVSVPKKLFKRAVKRNLLKRRIRESYRQLKSIIAAEQHDILFIYTSKTEHSYDTINKDIEGLLGAINKKRKVNG